MSNDMKTDSTEEIGVFSPAVANNYSSSCHSNEGLIDTDSYSRSTKNPTTSLNSRNINVKNLLLDISPQNLTKNSASPNRIAPLSLTIPNEKLSKRSSERTPCCKLLPKFTMIEKHLPSSRITSQVLDDATFYKSPLGSGNSQTLKSPFSASWITDEKCETQFSLTPAQRRFANYYVEKDEHHLESAPNYSTVSLHSSEGSASFRNNQTSVKKNKSHEELQESTAVNAYPDGPANVLDLILFLYSDPFLSEKPVDINDYDLVLNVAKECRNLESQFDSGKDRKYVHVPWSHTSSILKDLPKITKLLSEIDRPGKKALIHCQCGVLRSACVIVAYFMVKFKLSVNEAYELLKNGSKNMWESENGRKYPVGHFVEACEKICPNMNLIFELMDFGEHMKVSDVE